MERRFRGDQKMTSNETKTRKILAGLLAVVAVCFGPGAALAQNPHIDVTVEESGAVAEIVFQNSACPSGQRGCVQMPRNERNWISWELDQASHQAGWSFDARSLYFGTAEKQVGNLKDCTMSAFNLDESDRSSGHASTAEVFANGKRLRIWDENDSECITHYTLRAVNTSGKRAESDPVIDNRGRN
jgi:hypothetical protein